MSNYTKNTNFTAKDNLTSGDPAKVIKGAEFDTEFNALQTAVNSKADSNNSQLTGTTDAQAVETTGDVTVGGNLSVTGNATIEGNLTFGNADTDTVSFVADVDSSIIPDDDNTYDLGSATKQWRNVYVDGTANIDSLVADTADINGGTIDGVSISGSTASFSGEISANGGIALGDNDKATFGASDDLQIYHDGSSSYIKDVGSGNLNLTTNGTGIWMMNDAVTETMAKFIQNGAVTIYHNNAEKLATTSTGVDVTGTVTADGLTVDGDATVQSQSGNNATFLIGQSGITNWRLINEAGTGDLKINDSPTSSAMRITNGGDVSFYEDTGTTAKMVWDASAENLRIGSIEGLPNGSLSLKTTASGHAISLEENSGTERWQLGVNADGDLEFVNSADSDASIVFDDSGNVGIGTVATKVLTTGSALEIQSNQDGSELILGNNKTSTVGGEYLGGLIFKNSDTSGLQPHYSGIKAVASDSFGSANLEFYTGRENYENGTESVMRLLGGTAASDNVAIFNSNVGIGTTSPQEELHIEANYPQLRIASDLNVLGSNNLVAAVDGYATNGLAWRIGRVFGSAELQISNERSSAMTFATNGSERARIDSAGNLLVGKTALGYDTQGAELRADGRIVSCRDNGVATIISRNGTDGALTEFRKDGLPVGTIGNYGNRPYFASANCGIRLGGADLNPTTSTGAFSDNTVNLGADHTRFKDLYLSGGVYLGGTGAVNKLDDYEEGVFTPAANRSVGGDISATYTSQDGRYTKVGNLVHFEVYINLSAVSSQGSGYAMIAGMPFVASTAVSYIPSCQLQGSALLTNDVVTRAYVVSDKLYVGIDQNTSFPPKQLTWQSGVVKISGTYRTTQ